jgi:hypothetical protein
LGFLPHHGKWMRARHVASGLSQCLAGTRGHATAGGSARREFALPDHCESPARAAQEMVELIDPATRSALSDRVSVESLGPVPLKGRAVAVDVFSVVAGKSR